jgi:hypothetical protein
MNKRLGSCLMNGASDRGAPNASSWKFSVLKAVVCLGDVSSVMCDAQSLSRDLLCRYKATVDGVAVGGWFIGLRPPLVES